MQSKRNLIIGLLTLAVLLTGCSHVGRTIPPEKRIALEEGGPHSGTWSDFDCGMDYQYQLTRTEPATPGKLALKGSVRNRGKSLDSLSIWVDLLDAGGKILEQKTVYASGYRIEPVDQSFKLSLDTPPGTVAMSFGSLAQERKCSPGGR